MAMAATPDPRSHRIAKALISVEAAQKGRAVFDQLAEGHPSKSAENDHITREFLEETVRSAIVFGYPVEAVAVAADLSVADVLDIAGESAA